MQTCTTSRVGKVAGAFGSPSLSSSVRSVVCNATKKVNSYDENWKKGFWGTGLFLEDSEASSKSAFKKIEDKKLLSAVEKAGLLSSGCDASITIPGCEDL